MALFESIGMLEWGSISEYLRAMQSTVPNRQRRFLGLRQWGTRGITLNPFRRRESPPARDRPACRNRAHTIMHREAGELATVPTVNLDVTIASCISIVTSEMDRYVD